METSTVANMMNRDHMRAFFRCAAVLVAFVALLWAVQVVNWIIGYGLNPAFGLIPRYFGGLDGLLVMPLLHGSFVRQPGVSLEARLFGAIAGAACLIRTHVHVLRVRGVDQD